MGFDEAAELTMVIFDEENKLSHYRTGHRVTEEMIRNNKSIEMEITPPEPGKYAVYFTITNNEFPPTVHSYPLRLRVE
jgi:hypothetical protein